MNLETEKAPEVEGGRAHISANFFTYAAAGVLGVILGALSHLNDPLMQRPIGATIGMILLVAAVPALIGLLAKLFTEKTISYYPKTAFLAGLLVGFFWGWV